MNNEEYLKDIIREAVEDVLYEFKSDIEYETKAKLLKDRESGNHEKSNIKKYLGSTNKHVSVIPPRSTGTVSRPDTYPHPAKTMKDKMRRDNTNNSHIERFDNKMRNMDKSRKLNKMFDSMLDK
jgi:hypothetical protein